MPGFLSLIIADPASVGADVFLAVILTAMAIWLYFLPTLIAKRRKKANLQSVFALNLFLGWLVVGWVVALVWALAKDALCAGCGSGLIGGQAFCAHCGRARG